MLLTFVVYLLMVVVIGQGQSKGGPEGSFGPGLKLKEILKLRYLLIFVGICAIWSPVPGVFIFLLLLLLLLLMLYLVNIVFLTLFLPGLDISKAESSPLSFGPMRCLKWL